MALNLDTLPASCPWNMYAGDANKQSLQFLVNGSPLNLTGYIIKAQARTTPMASTISLTATTTIEAVTGIVTITWDGEAMRTLLDAAGNWSGYWDLQIQASAGVLPTTILAGPVTIRSDVTRGP